MGNDGEDSYQIKILAIIVKFLLSIGHLHPHKSGVVAKIGVKCPLSVWVNLPRQICIFGFESLKKYY